jgi:hypothetical protein
MIELTRERIIENAKMMPGNVGIYRVNHNTYETIYSSEGIPALLGMSIADYQKETGARTQSMRSVRRISRP